MRIPLLAAEQEQIGALGRHDGFDSARDAMHHRRQSQVRVLFEVANDIARYAPSEPAERVDIEGHPDLCAHVLPG